MSRLLIAFKALRDLGPKQLGFYAWYQFGLRSGYLRWKTGGQREIGGAKDYALYTQPLQIPSAEELSVIMDAGDIENLIAEADEIVRGQVRLFGGPPVELKLVVPGPLVHWTAYEKGLHVAGIEDIKWVWEPGRFGWAYTLGRAYLVSADERYPQAFWQHTETFLEANPANLGPHWASAQEVALRLVTMTFAARLFEASPHTTPERKALLASAIAAHAQRIPPTLAYARAQNNNHLLTEAAGLYTAGLVLPDHPSAQTWVELGWRWFNQAIQTQIAGDGTYVQQSTNYHRLMLQIALWVDKLAREFAAQPVGNERKESIFPEKTRHKLDRATHWLLAMLDPITGGVPNLGPNDGAYIFPLSSRPYSDYRPVLQAACCAFLGERPFNAGAWDEMALWFGCRTGDYPVGMPAPSTASVSSEVDEVPILRLTERESWAYLRATQFEARPGHADQLHLDIWWRGINVAQDAGTYLYNAPHPWDNSLSHSAVHNTLTVNGRDQMTPAGRFLYLDWAQAKVVARQPAEGGPWERLAARHDGYRNLGVTHWRIAECTSSGWQVIDSLLAADSSQRPPIQAFDVRLHWLLPDWPWEIEVFTLRVQSPYGWIKLQETVEANQANAAQNNPPALQLVRAGELLYGSGPFSPSWGWVSPTYGYKQPALSFSLALKGRLPLSITSQWEFPGGD